MSYKLSVLDTSPVLEGETPSNALARTVALAKRAEELGYHRFWVAEHHDSSDLAGPSPEILAAFILASTSRIRVGSGGVMLQHYSPYKVAENFNLLAALAPERVDLGVGKAPGGFPLSTKGLQWAIDPENNPDFATRLQYLSTFLDGSFSAPHPLAGLSAHPKPPVTLERFLLGASVESATLAAANRWRFVYAGHINGDDASIARAFEAYRDASGGDTALLALSVITATSEADAAGKAPDYRIFKITLDNGQSANLENVGQAEEFARQAGARDYRIEEKKPRILYGSARRIKDEFERLHQRLGVREFVLDFPVTGGTERLASLQLLAREKHPALAN